MNHIKTFRGALGPRGRKDRSKGISLYTETILDDVEREEATRASGLTPPASPNDEPPSIQSPLHPPSVSPRGALSPKRAGMPLAHSANVPVRPARPSPRNAGGSDIMHPQSPASVPPPTSTPSTPSESPSKNEATVTGEVALLLDGDDPDAVFRQKDEDISKLRDNLKRVTAAGKKYNTEATKHTKGIYSMADSIEKIYQCDKKYHPDSVFVEALTKFVQIDKAIADSTAKYHQSLNDRIVVNINNFIEEDIQHELKNLKAKYEKARRDYDSACAKVTSLRARKNLDITKLYTAEKDAIKAKQRYRNALEAALAKAEDIELKKQTDLLEWIICACSEEGKQSFGECFAMLNHIMQYLQELTNWCQEWEAIFKENTAARNSEQQQKILDEENSAHLPLVELAKNTELVAIMKQVAADEGVSMPTLDGSLSTNWQPLHAFLRDNYDRVSQALSLAGKRALLTELSSALGLLEKAKEVIDMSL